jgi:hypothetical protein
MLFFEMLGEEPFHNISNGPHFNRILAQYFVTHIQVLHTIPKTHKVYILATHI